MRLKDNARVSLEQLEPRLMLNSDPLGSYPFDTAQLVTVNPASSVAVNSSMPPADQTQLYRFTAPAAGLFWIGMSALNSSLDSVLQVYNARGRRCGYNDNASRYSLDSSVRLRVRPGQTYYVLAGGKNGTSGTYQLTLTSDPRDDAGNTLLSAKDIRMRRGRARIRGTINYTGDEDVFRIVADTTGPMELLLAGSGRLSDLAPELYVYDSQGNLLASETGAAGSSVTASLDVTAGQTYYLKAAGTYSGRSGRYQLSVECPTDDIGGTFAAASDITLRRNRGRACGTINFTNDVDMFRISPTSGGQLNIDLTGGRRGSTIEGEIFVYDAQGNELAHDDNFDGSSASLTVGVNQGQTYYVKVAGTYTFGGSLYSLSVQYDPDDVGNTFDTARQIPLVDGAGSTAASLDYLGDIDMFSLVSSMTGSMTVDLTAYGSSYLDTTLTVYNSSREQIAYDDDGGPGLNSRATFDVTSGESYYLKARSYYDLSQGSYLVGIATEEVIPDPEPDPEPTPDPTPDPGDPEPGSQVIAEVVDQGGGYQLRVLGTNSADIITVSQTANTITWQSGSETHTYAGNFVSVLVYGFDGSDTIRLMNTVSASGSIYAGTGDDTIFENALGSVTVSAGDGDDLIVAVGGGSDTVYGGAGFDSFWVDSSDTVSDASSAETSAKTVHSITEFYQPYTTNPGSSQYVSLEISGQNLTDPVATSSASGWANFADTSLFVDGPQYDDIVQGYIGDCYYVASLASLADTDPMIIEQMVTPLGDGTYAVRFHRSGQEVYLRVDADLPVNGSGNLVYARTGPDGELWVPVVEKAYCYFRYGQNSYASISGGWMSTVYREVTGGYTNTTYTSTITASSLYTHIANQLAQGHAVTLGSYHDASSPIVAGHAYMVKSAHVSGSQQYVTVYNPWGYDAYSWDSNFYDGLLTLSIQQIQANFSAVVTSLV